MIAGLFSHHDRWSVKVAVWNLRKDAAVSQSQIIDPYDPRFWIHHSQWIIWRAHPARAARMIGAFHMVRNKPVQVTVALQCRPRLNFVFHKGLERVLCKNLSGEPYTGAKLLPIAGLRHIVKQDFRRGSRIG